MTLRAEIVVVGAGPCGSTLARELAAAAREVLLLDRESFPRRKTCGGGLPPRALRLLGPATGRIAAGRVARVALDGALTGRKVYELGEAACAVVERAEFDLLLAQEAERAGARFLQGCAIAAVKRVTGGFSISTSRGEIVCATLCCCDGVFSPSARMLGFSPNARGFCLEASAPFPADASAEARETAVFNLACLRGGYAWSFPARDRLNLGIGGALAEAPQLRRKLQEFVSVTPEIRGAEIVSLHGGMIPDFRAPREAYVRDGAFLAGDAAGLADPLTGEGIYYALLSAQLAAQAILQRDENLYGELLRAELLPELSLAARLAKIFRRTSAPLRRLLLSLPGMGRRTRAFVDILSGVSTYRQIFPHRARPGKAGSDCQ